MTVAKYASLGLGVIAFFVLSQACARRSERAPTPRVVNSSASSTTAPGAGSIAVLGSSTAAGFGLSDEATSWVERYAAYLSGSPPGLTVKNFAVPGFTTFQALPTGSRHRWGTPRVDTAHNVTAALEGRPIAIVVNLPSNDASAGFTVEETMTNLRAIVGKAAEAGVPTWVTTSQPRILDEQGTALLDRMRDAVLRDFAGRCLDFWTPLATAEGRPLRAYNQGDGIHPNAEGHRLLFEVVKAADIPGHVLSH